MKYFDAQKRKKTYIEGSNRATHEFNLNSKEYTAIPVEEQLDYIKEMMKNTDFKSGFANKIIFNIFEEGDLDEIMTEHETFGLMSNIVSAYTEHFPEQIEKVLLPSLDLLENLPISPVVLIQLTNKRIVNKPIQVILKFKHKESGGEMEVKLI